MRFLTHLQIVGSIIGFSLVYGGRDAVNWATPDKASFPPYRVRTPTCLHGNCITLRSSANHGHVACTGGTTAVASFRNLPILCTFPLLATCRQGVVPIFVSWVTSPVLTAAASALIFFITRFLVLRRKNSYQLSFWVLPPMVMATTWICVYFTFTRGAKRMLDSSG